ncbi:hypothetical protein Tco_0931611 [Tanacetum coccineum]
MASMIEVINHESSVTPLPFTEKKGKKKSQTVFNPNQRHKALRLPKHSLKRGKIPSPKQPSLFRPLSHHPGTTQPAVKGLHSPLDEGTRKSKPLLEGDDTESQVDATQFTCNCDNHDLRRLVKPLVLTYAPVAIYGVCDSVCLYEFMWVM